MSFSTQTIINDVPPYTPGVAVGGQTVFGTNWTANYETDVVVYYTPVGVPANDATQILSYPSQFSVTFVGDQQQVQVTLVTPANLGDRITITRMTPADRENLYTNTNFTPTMLNQDFGILTLVDQQAQLVNQLIGPRYNYSAIIQPVIDTILPILPANHLWAKNDDNTAIIAVDIEGISSGVVNPASANEIAYYITDGNEVSGLPTANNGVLITSSSGVPSILPGPGITGQVLTSNAAAAPSWTTLGVTTPGNMIYVSNEGSDLTGNGSFSNPFATVAHAEISITTASASNPFTISVIGGLIVETAQILMKPFVAIAGLSEGVIIQLFTFSKLDSSWATTSGGFLSLFNFSWTNADIELDFSTFTNVTSHKINVDDLISPSQTIELNGSANTSPTLYGNDCILLNFKLQNSYAEFRSSTIGNVIGNQFNVGVNTTTCYLISNHILFGLDLRSSNGFSANYYLTGDKTDATVTVTGATATIYQDVSSYIAPSLVLGATSRLLNIADGLDANYNPSNYTPVSTAPTLPTSVQAHLRGIDNSLEFLTGSIPNIVYVSLNGSDTNGTGSILNPYETVSNSMSFITSATASVPYTLFLTDGVFNETNQILLKPFVSVVGSSSNVTINNSSDIILDSSWNGTTNGTISIENVYINNNLVLDFTTVSTASSPIVDISNTTVQGTLTLNGNTDNPNIFFLYDSYFNDAVINNITCESFTNYYFGGITAGTTSFIANTSFSSTSDFYNSSVILNGASSGSAVQVYNFKASTLNSTLSLSGSKATLNIDVSSYVTPTISGGAVLNLTSISNGMNANYSPSFYTPTATSPTLVTSAEAHLRGIDAQFGILRNTYVSNSATNVLLTSSPNVNNVVSISLNAGQWEVSGVVGFIANTTTTVLQIAAAISEVSAVLPSFPTENNIQLLTAAITTGSTNYLSCGPTRINLSTPTTVYLVCRSTFGVSTMTADGFIKAYPV